MSNIPLYLPILTIEEKIMIRRAIPVVALFFLWACEQLKQESTDSSTIARGNGRFFRNEEADAVIDSPSYREVLEEIQQAALIFSNPANPLCHNLTNEEMALGVNRFSLNTEAYNEAMQHLHASTVWVQSGSGNTPTSAGDYASGGGKLYIRVCSSFGSTDENWFDSSIGNFYISGQIVFNPDQCQPLSPWNPPIEGDEFARYQELRKAWQTDQREVTLGDFSIPKLPQNPGNTQDGVFVRIIAGAYQANHAPSEAPAGTPNQCEWGPGIMQRVTYKNEQDETTGLFLVDLDSTPGFQEYVGEASAILCLRLSESDSSFFGHQYLLNVPVNMAQLAEEGPTGITLAANPQDVRSVFYYSNVEDTGDIHGLTPAAITLFVN